MVFASFLPEAGQTFVFDYVSIVFIVILLISLIAAAKKGFVAALIGLVCYIGSYILASMFCQSLGATIFNAGPGEIVYNAIFNWISSKGGIFNETITQANMVEKLAQAFTALGIPEFLSPTLASLVQQMNIIPAGEEGIVLSIAISQTVSAYAFIAAAWLIICLGVQLICTIILACLKKVIKKLKLKAVDCMLGGLIGIASGAMTCVVIAYVLVLGLTCTSFLDFLKPMIAWDDPNTYTITKALCTTASEVASMFIA